MCDVWADQNDATLDGYNGKARRTDEAFPAKKGPPTMGRNETNVRTTQQNDGCIYQDMNYG